MSREFYLMFKRKNWKSFQGTKIANLFIQRFLIEEISSSF